MNLIHKILLAFFLISFFQSTTATGTKPPFLKYLGDSWVNSRMESLTLDEKIAQLMMISVYPSQDETNQKNIAALVEKWKPGGILVMQGSPVKTARWINSFQEKSTVPLLVAVDGEWGLAMRTDSVMEFINAQAVGAIQDTTWIYQMGRDMGTQLKAMGIHINFAPVADVNTNPQNPVIHFRSFGEDKKNVAQKAWMVAKGMQDAEIVPVAKHFPGHGDTQADSHKTLPLLMHSKERMDSLETFPFRYLTERGIPGIMSAHLNVPSLDNSGTPSSLSKKIITGYLKETIGFSGIVVTDAINMQGVRTEKGNTEVEALKAGNDIVEFVPDLPKAIESVKKAVENGELSMQEIDEKCRKVLALKRWANLNHYQPADTKNLTARLNSPYFEVTNRKLIQGSLTVLNNRNILPIQKLDSFKIAAVMIGADRITPFQKTIDKYAETDHFFLPKNASERDWSVLQGKLKNYNLIIAGVQGINRYPGQKYGTSEIQRKAVAEIVQLNNSIVVFFGNAYALKYFENIHQSRGLVVAYQNLPLIQDLAAQLLFGAFDASGKLPVSVDERFPVNFGITVKKNDCLGYTIPEEAGINSVMLRQKIDSLAQLGIENAAFPGCQVLFAKNGKVIFHECYGQHTYFSDAPPVEPDHLYDWASVTKVTGPLPVLMKLVDEKKISLDAPASHYRKDLTGTNKENLKMREILTHQAGLAAWIPFWQMALDENKELDRNIFSASPSEKFNIRVSSELYMNEDFTKTIFDTIRNSKLQLQKKYLYSDLGFHLFPGLITEVTRQPYETYLKNHFLRPLGAYTVTYNPYRHFPLDRIIPTETDDFFRKETIRGFVHDEGAALMDGVSGNAGLFGTAGDLAKIFQMYLQKGYYGGRRYLSEETVSEFTRIQYPANGNRRGLGFDKPLINNQKNSLKNAYPAYSASKNSFGHSGFTGIFVWADPDQQLLYIFLSNRVYPTRENPKLYDLNIRTAMHQVIYDCIKKGQNNY
jgi:beta-glucosidase-like glycosyl hydrolase/CubicO group peptidase (beta-lactamase class C family)